MKKTRSAAVRGRKRNGRAAAEVDRAWEKSEEEAEVARQWGQANSESAGRPLGSAREAAEDEREQYNSQFQKVGAYEAGNEQELSRAEQQDQWGRQDKAGGGAGEEAAGARKKGVKKAAAGKRQR